MHKSAVTPTGEERTFGRNEIIVSKTDLKGRVTYANEVFLRVSGYREDEVIGRPHSLIRHPAMPRCVFKLLWDTIQGGQEIFAYVLNLAADGAHYWVLAHVTPTFDASGAIIGYHSNRRTPTRAALDRVEPLYAALLAEERKHDHPIAAMEASGRLLADQLEALGMTYDEFVWSLDPEEEVAA